MGDPCAGAIGDEEYLFEFMNSRFLSPGNEEGKLAKIPRGSPGSSLGTLGKSPNITGMLNDLVTTIKNLDEILWFQFNNVY